MQASTSERLAPEQVPAGGPAPTDSPPRAGADGAGEQDAGAGEGQEPALPPARRDLGVPSQEGGAPATSGTDASPGTPPVVSQLLARVEEVEDRVRIRSEAGVLDDQRRGRIAQDLVPGVEAARRALAGVDLVVASTKVLQAELLADQILQEHGLRRLLIVYNLPIVLYYLVLAGGLAALGLGELGSSGAAVWGVPVLYVAAGSLGACFRGLWWITRKAMKGQYRVWFFVPYLLGPFIGAFLGAVVYLLFDIGLIAADDADGEAQLNAVPTLFAFLAGHSWEWALEKIEAFRRSK